MAKILACGDVVNYKNLDGLLLSAEISEIVKNADYSVCNFEAPIEGFGTPQPKSGPHHAQRRETLTGLREQGFDLALLANNHILDFGKKGLLATIEEAKRVGLETTGAGVNEATAYMPLIKEIKGLRVGIINACEAQFGVIDHFKRFESAGYAWINHPIIVKTILKLKIECDFVLVFVHAGLENYSIPQKEWREHYKHLCDLGADAVIAAHPHVPQGYERHNDSLIFYSLGNFYFDGGRWANSESISYAVMLTLEKGSPISFEPIYHYTSSGKVRLALEEKKINLEELCGLLGETYNQAHDEMVAQAYKSIRRNLVRSFFSFPIDTTLKGTMKEIAATLLGRRKKLNKSLLAMHLMRNETYYYVMRHALELEAQKMFEK